MELICWDPECVGNELAAGEVGPGTQACQFCCKPLERPDGRVLLRGPVPVLAPGRVPEDFDDLMDGLRDGPALVGDVSVIRQGGKTLYSVLLEDGYVLAAGVTSACGGRALRNLMGLLDG